jgi:hypothetical protein
LRSRPQALSLESVAQITSVAGLQIDLEISAL